MITNKFSHETSWRFTALVASFFIACTSFAATSVSQHGITWTFDKDYPIGQYANGDYWVQGPITVISISPGSQIVNGRTINGSMINPVAGTSASQGFDSSMTANKYVATLNVALPNGTPVSAANPLTVNVNSSLVSTISHPTAANRPQLTDAAVLTVVNAPPPAAAFRPPYVGNDKAHIASASDIDWSRLGSLPKPSNTPSSIGTVANYFARPWIEINTQFGGREMHPINNQPNYGREMANQLATGLLMLQLNYTTQEKRDLAIRLIQYGIDIYGGARGGATWPNNGGHNMGRKMPLLLAAHLLNNPQMMAFGNGTVHRIFQEDQNCFYVSITEVNLTNSTKWAPDTRGGTPEPYTLSDIGMPEWGIQHYTSPDADNKAWSATYRDIASSATVGHVLTAHIMGLTDEWNWPATIDYYDRYANIEIPFAGTGTNKMSLFVASMWTAYRNAKQIAPANAKIQIATQ